VILDADGSTWFSDVIKLDTAIGQTNDLLVTVKRGVTVRGQLDSNVPRPVKGGRIIANIWPPNLKPNDDPPQWHAWSTIKEDGTFAIDNLPEGDLEILALCGGFVSTNGPGTFGFRYPQKHLLSTNGLDIIVGMEPTARLEVTLRDEQGRPLKDVHVQTWPNARYGEWAAVLLMGDRYNTQELLQLKPDAKPIWNQPVWDFQGISDSTGLAVLSNLPPETKELVAENAQFTLPITQTSDGQKNRQASITLVAGQTNRISLQLVPHKRTKIGHY
jgi:hypothetical protein